MAAERMVAFLAAMQPYIPTRSNGLSISAAVVAEAYLVDRGRKRADLFVVSRS